ncbi:diaminopimelate epimerase [Corticimicrobacter populi]|uniref:Diaminopimelate epimerase n=1 Tax=Corticimicrobacter populi TaxID=2175229 RepID=A0A2V1K064_9BURK|nr:diaminopimelate epimerase [Corticimicrobacter populi]PWF21905.1 diaminopimelate epimerase [Corticimicrobacter populi]
MAFYEFTKMHGAGNDFIVLDGVRQQISLSPAQLRALADRRFGIGADQILLVEPAQHGEADFRYRIFNADGSEVEHCGNGARCFVRFVHEQGLSDRNPLHAEIATGTLTLTEQADGEVTVDMGICRFEPATLPFDPDGLTTRTTGEATQWALPLEGETEPVWIVPVSISNPHAVQVVTDVDTAPVARTGPLIESHPRFARRVNAGFMQILGRHDIRLRVYERGAGETLACGTGACAAAVAGIRLGLLDSPVRVQTRGGDLTIRWDGTRLAMTGPATTVFTGRFDTDTLVGD